VAPATRVAYALAIAAAAALVAPVAVAPQAKVAVVTAAAVDAWSVRGPSTLIRDAPRVVARGKPGALTVRQDRPETARGAVRIRQGGAPDVQVAPQEADGELVTSFVARRRGRHELPPVAYRRDGPLGLGRWYHRGTEELQVLSYPDVPGARRIATAVARGRFRDPGRMRHGPLGLGTDFESVRDYLPDDDIRQVNWAATGRMGRPMSNQYRVDQDREVVCLVDCGRLMAAPVAGGTRLDAAIDAVAAVAAVADQVGDRCGAIAFDARIRRRIHSQRGAAREIVRGLFDLEPSSDDSDYELAFRTVGGGKRALVIVFTDLLDTAAARSLLEATPYLVRRHAMLFVSTRDPQIAALVSTSPSRTADVYRASVAAGVLKERDRVAHFLRRRGATVVDAAPEQLPAISVSAYLRAKARARL
jgi:uncharacterized protein (DUF58 family)